MNTSITWSLSFGDFLFPVNEVVIRELSIWLPILYNLVCGGEKKIIYIALFSYKKALIIKTDFCFYFILFFFFFTALLIF